MPPPASATASQRSGLDSLPVDILTKYFYGDQPLIDSRESFFEIPPALSRVTSSQRLALFDIKLTQLFDSPVPTEALLLTPDYPKCEKFATTLRMIEWGLVRGLMSNGQYDDICQSYVSKYNTVNGLRLALFQFIEFNNPTLLRLHALLMLYKVKISKVDDRQQQLLRLIDIFSMHPAAYPVAILAKLLQEPQKFQPKLINIINQLLASAVKYADADCASQRVNFSILSALRYCMQLLRLQLHDKNNSISLNDLQNWLLQLFQIFSKWPINSLPYSTGSSVRNDLTELSFLLFMHLDSNRAVKLILNPESAIITGLTKAASYNLPRKGLYFLIVEEAISKVVSAKEHDGRDAILLMSKLNRQVEDFYSNTPDSRKNHFITRRGVLYYLNNIYRIASSDAVAPIQLREFMSHLSQPHLLQLLKMVYFAKHYEGFPNTENRVSFLSLLFERCPELNTTQTEQPSVSANTNTVDVLFANLTEVATMLSDYRSDAMKKILLLLDSNSRMQLLIGRFNTDEWQDGLVKKIALDSSLTLLFIGDVSAFEAKQLLYGWCDASDEVHVGFMQRAYQSLDCKQAFLNYIQLCIALINKLDFDQVYILLNRRSDTQGVSHHRVLDMMAKGSLALYFFKIVDAIMSKTDDQEKLKETAYNVSETLLSFMDDDTELTHSNSTTLSKIFHDDKDKEVFHSFVYQNIQRLDPEKKIELHKPTTLFWLDRFTETPKAAYAIDVDSIQGKVLCVYIRSLSPEQINECLKKYFDTCFGLVSDGLDLEKYKYILVNTIVVFRVFMLNLDVAGHDKLLSFLYYLWEQTIGRSGIPPELILGLAKTIQEALPYASLSAVKRIFNGIQDLLKTTRYPEQQLIIGTGAISSQNTIFDAAIAIIKKCVSILDDDDYTNSESCDFLRLLVDAFPKDIKHSLDITTPRDTIETQRKIQCLVYYDLLPRFMRFMNDEQVWELITNLHALLWKKNWNPDAMGEGDFPMFERDDDFFCNRNIYSPDEINAFSFLSPAQSLFLRLIKVCFQKLSHEHTGKILLLLLQMIGETVDDSDSVICVYKIARFQQSNQISIILSLFNSLIIEIIRNAPNKQVVEEYASVLAKKLPLLFAIKPLNEDLIKILLMQYGESEKRLSEITNLFNSIYEVAPKSLKPEILALMLDAIYRAEPHEVEQLQVEQLHGLTPLDRQEVSHMLQFCNIDSRIAGRVSMMPEKLRCVGDSQTRCSGGNLNIFSTTNTASDQASTVYDNASDDGAASNISGSAQHFEQANNDNSLNVQPDFS